MAKPSRRPVTTSPGRSCKVQTVIDVSLYSRLAAAAALRGVTHSAYVQSAIERALTEDGVMVIRRRGGLANPSGQEELSADEAA